MDARLTVLHNEPANSKIIIHKPSIHFDVLHFLHSYISNKFRDDLSQSPFHPQPVSSY